MVIDVELATHFIYIVLVHSKLCSITHVATKVHVMLRSFVVWTWMHDRINVTCDTTEEHKVQHFNGVVCSTPLGLPWRCGICMHQHSTSGIRRRWIRIRRWHSTYWQMVQCEGVSWLLGCINDKIRDIRERNVTARSEIWNTNIRSLGFQDIRERVTLWRLTLRSLGSTT